MNTPRSALRPARPGASLAGAFALVASLLFGCAAPISEGGSDDAPVAESAATTTSGVRFRIEAAGARLEAYDLAARRSDFERTVRATHKLLPTLAKADATRICSLAERADANTLPAAVDHVVVVRSAETKSYEALIVDGDARPLATAGSAARCEDAVAQVTAVGRAAERVTWSLVVVGRFTGVTLGSETPGPTPADVVATANAVVTLGAAAPLGLRSACAKVGATPIHRLGSYGIEVSSSEWTARFRVLLLDGAKIVVAARERAQSCEEAVASIDTLVGGLDVVRATW